MKKRRNTWLFMVVVFVIFSIISVKCRKEDQKYDLFPLKVGNEYYYQYSNSFDDFVVGNSTIGIEKWTVLTDSIKNKNVEYFIEKKFNGIYIDWSTLQGNSHRDTTIIEDRIDHFVIVESPSSELQFWDISIPRYCNKPDSIIRTQGYSMDYTKTYYFSAGSGLTQYYKFWGLMQNRIRESYIQDSVKIAN